ncbi:hypothetical protein HYC85_022424 [Camellia sinensis]|uniref:No apical meristem-associated C-terminal domain-containing protein n=1 Tax=Camellia sinensis TaxID=4442 RepID=A0A7J7GL92_CAMSI|nr:hypothetical protein HYC85_022424 [Camellia sinensis]
MANKPFPALRSNHTSVWSTTKHKTNKSKGLEARRAAETSENSRRTRTWIIIKCSNDDVQVLRTVKNGVAKAKRMYHVIQKKHFTFDTCWDILRRSCKWNEFRTQSKKSTQHAYPCSNPPTGESDAFQSNQNNVLHEEPSNPSTQPIGTKAAKEKLKNQTTHDSRFDEMATNQSKMVEVLSTISARTIERDEPKAIDRNQKAADRRRRAEDREEQLKLLSMMNEREQRNEDHKIMSMDMTNLNPMQRAYYEDLQR